MSLTLRHSATSNVSDHNTQAMQNYSIKNVWKDVRQTMIYQFNSLVQGSLTLAQQTKTFVDMITCWPTPSLVCIFTYMLRTTDALETETLVDMITSCWPTQNQKCIYTCMSSGSQRACSAGVHVRMWLRYLSSSLLAWLTVL